MDLASDALVGAPPHSRGAACLQGRDAGYRLQPFAAGARLPGRPG